METHNLKGGLWNLLISLGAVLGAGIVLMTGTTTAVAVAVFLGAGVLVALVSWVHMHLANREGLEALELEEVSGNRGDEALFAEGEVLPARRSRENFEKWGVPVVSVVVLFIQAWGVYYLSQQKLPGLLEAITRDAAGEKPERMMQFGSLIISALLGLILFMRGQFASNFSRIEKQRLMQPASDYVLFGAYLNFALTAMVAVSFKFPQADYYVALALTILLGIMALENLLSMIFEIYRPRMAGRRMRLLYESRLVGLIAKPENLFTTVGKVLNYQFGFKVSETWGYQFLRKRLWVLFGVQVILLWLSTSVVVIQPSEIGKQVDVLGGSKKAKTLEPGFHLKLPWPFAQVDRFYPGQIHTFVVGLQPVENPSRVRMWADPVGEGYEALRQTGELYFMAGSSVSKSPRDQNGTQSQLADILVASIPVHYRIRREQLDEGWLKFQQSRINPGGKSDAQLLLENIAYREISAYFLGSNLAQLIQNRAKNASQTVKDAIQKHADERGLGVEILFVGLGNIRPPAESPKNIKDTEAEREEADGPPKDDSRAHLSGMPMAVAAEMRFANAVKARTLLQVAKESELVENMWREAELKQVESQKLMDISLANIQATAERDRLSGESGAYRAFPSLYRRWRYLDSFGKAVSPARKYIIAVGKHTEVEVNLDLQERLQGQMYQVTPDKKPK